MIEIFSIQLPQLEFKFCSLLPPELILVYVTYLFPPALMGDELYTQQVFLYSHLSPIDIFMVEFWVVSLESLSSV